jgi:predicted unusual protein kinase regulating ubiquinone biosynthesis (AarF/ABC1/UbiB family)
MKLPTAGNLQRYKQIARFLWKYGRSDLVQQLGIDEALAGEDRNLPTATTGAVAEQLVNDLEAMGPTYVKLGQILSTRPDLLPDAYVRALSRLQDKVKPFDYPEVEAIVCSELDVRLSKAFSRFDPVPTAAASLGQVHNAALRDGREVVVKVQRPDVVKQVTEDFEVLRQIAEFLDAHTDLGKRRRFAQTLQEFRITIMNELDYEREAQNLVRVGKNLAEFDRIVVPQPVLDYCSRRVLTMDYVQGAKITELSPIARLDMDGPALASQLFKAYLKQVLVDGIFHADPHPGNVFVTADGCVALLDLGMVGYTTPAMQENLLKILIAISEAKSESAVDTIVRISETAEHFDSVQFKRRIAQVILETHDQGLRQMNIGRSLLQVTTIAAELGLYVPSELTLLGKTLMQLDEVGKILDPDFDPNYAVRSNVAEIVARRMKHATQGSFFGTMLEMKDFLAGLPTRLSKILDAIANREIEVSVKAVDANLMLEGLQKIANRITSGVILAALIVGASLLMRIETSFVLFGYPGLAIICFLAAAAGGVYLLVSIFIQDEKSQRRASRQRQQHL